MAVTKSMKYGIVVAAIAVAIIAGAAVTMSPTTTPSQVSTQSSSSQMTSSQTSSHGTTTIQLSSSATSAQGQGGSGVLSIYLTDAPPSSPTLKYLLVNVSSLKLTYQENNTTSTSTSASTSASSSSSSSTTTTSSGTSTSATTTSTEAKPQNVYILTVPANVGTNVNLTSLHGQSLLLGATTMPAGNITSMVLNITGAKAFYTDGTSAQLKVVANGMLMIPIHFSVQPNGSTDLTIDLTPNTVHISQADVLTPVIHVTSVERGNGTTSTHTTEVDEATESRTTSTSSTNAMG